MQWPEGYDVADLPEGWTRSGAGRATYDDPGLVTQPSFSITGSAAAGRRALDSPAWNAFS